MNDKYNQTNIYTSAGAWGTPSEIYQYTATFNDYYHFTFQNNFVGLSNNGNMKVDDTTRYNITLQDTFWVEEESDFSFEALIHSYNNINYCLDHWSDQSTLISRTINNVSNHGSFTAYFTGIPTHVQNVSDDGQTGQPIHLVWDQHLNSNCQYRIYRRAKYQHEEDYPPAVLLATLSNNTTEYTDHDYDKTSGYTQYLLRYDVRAYYTVEQTEAETNWYSVFGGHLFKRNPEYPDSTSLHEQILFNYSIFPNPCNPETTIEYALPEAANIRISIFNVNGQLVQTIINGTNEAGYHRVKWRGTNQFGQILASGVYWSQ